VFRFVTAFFTCASVAAAAPRSGRRTSPAATRGSSASGTSRRTRPSDSSSAPTAPWDLQEVFYRVDSSAAPKRMDWSLNKGKTWFLGVYEITGDRMEVNLGQGGTGVRPGSVEKADRFEYRSFMRKKPDR
jgi:hypothetical protein